MKRILVVANETVAGKPLIDAVRERGAGDEVDVHVICPQNQPRHGYVIYDSTVRDAAENRLHMTLALLHEAFGRRTKTRTAPPGAEAAAMPFWALPAPGQTTMRKADGWQGLGQAPTDRAIDLAARPDTVTVPEAPPALSNSLRDGTSAL